MSERLELFAELQGMSRQESVLDTPKKPFPYMELYGMKRQQRITTRPQKTGNQMGEKLHQLAGKIRNREHAHLHNNTLSYVRDTFSIKNVLEKFQAGHSVTPTYKLKRIHHRKASPAPPIKIASNLEDIAHLTERYYPQIKLRSQVKNILKNSLRHKSFTQDEYNTPRFNTLKTKLPPLKDRASSLHERTSQVNLTAEKNSDSRKRLPLRKTLKLTADANVFADFPESDELTNKYDQG